MIEIESKLIQSNLTHKIRLSVLWPHKNISNCFLAEDNLKDTYHVGTFQKNELVSIGTFIYQNNIIFDENDKQYRLRAMATEKKHQGISMGRRLIMFAKNELITDVNVLALIKSTGLKSSLSRTFILSLIVLDILASPTPN